MLARCSPRGMNASIGAGGGGAGMITACGHSPGSVRGAALSGLGASETIAGSDTGEACLGGVANGFCPKSAKAPLCSDRKLGTDA